MPVLVLNEAQFVFYEKQPLVEFYVLLLLQADFEGSNYFLRITIDRAQPIDVDTCVEVTHAVNPILDEADIIKDSYILDISSKEKGD